MKVTDLPLSELERADQPAPMRLSEAIRRGEKMRPQSFTSTRDKNGGSCAIGAALDGGYDRTIGYDLISEIVRLNDLERWTREQIADWLAERGL